MANRRLAPVAFLVTVLGSLVVFGCGEKNEFVAPPPPKVTVAHPVTREVADSMEFVGTTRATATVDLRARVNGYLEKINFEDGADVQAAQQLFEIEQAPYLAALDAAKAALQKAQAELQLAQSQYRRMEPLVAQRAITPDDLEVQAAQVATSNADVAAAQAALRTAELNLQYTVVRAPIAGHIGRHLVDLGNLVQAEATLLAEIQSIDPIYAYFDLSERDLLRFMEMLRQRQLPDPDKNPPVLHLGLENEPSFPHVGKLDFRELAVNEGTGTTTRRGIFPNPGRRLLPGMFVRIRAQIGDPAPKLMVEDRALGADQRGDYVLVVNQKNVVEHRPVRLGIASEGMRVIEEGVNANDWVVTNGLQRARPGVEVTPEQAEMAAAVEAPAVTPAANIQSTPAGGGNAATAKQPQAPASGKAGAATPAKNSPAAEQKK